MFACLPEYCSHPGEPRHSNFRIERPRLRPSAENIFGRATALLMTTAVQPEQREAALAAFEDAQAAAAKAFGDARGCTLLLKHI